MFSLVLIVLAAAVILAGGFIAGRRSGRPAAPPLNDMQIAAPTGETEPASPYDITLPRRQMLRDVLDALPVSITIVGPDGNYLFVNDNEANRWGYDKEAAIGQSAYNLLPPDIADNARREDRQIFETGEPIPFFEERATVGDDKVASLIGKIPMRDDAGSTEAVCMISLDVTDRLQAREALERSNADYRRTLEFFPEAVYVTIEGQIAFANRAARDLFRTADNKDIIGGSSINLIHPQDHGLIENDRQRLRAGDSNTKNRSYRYCRLDGTTFTGLGSATSITWDDRHAVLVLVRDITAQLKRNAEIEEARHAADEANRAKSEFLASMSHEIRTPLNGMLGMANILRDGDLTAEQRRQIGIILDSGGLLLTLLNDILDLSKIEAGMLELEVIDFDITTLLDSLHDIWAVKAAEKNLNYIHNTGTLAAPTLMADPTRLRQILFNLVSNAVKFTATGEIRVDVTQTRMPDGLYETRFEVSDTGEGIAPENLETLFSKFTQADSSATRRHGGTGLGLSITKKLVEAMDGQIGINSTLGKGSTFWFTIICPEGNPANTIDVPHSAGTSGETRPLEVLVAEDNEVNQVVINALLENAGHSVTIAKNGVEAVHAATEGIYDVILMDIHMPELDGVSATRKIRQLEGSRGQVPIVALTANAMKGNREEFVGNGMNDYVSKPIDPEKLTAALRRQCGDAVSGSTVETPAVAAPPSRSDTHLSDELSVLFDQIESSVN